MAAKRTRGKVYTMGVGGYQLPPEQKPTLPKPRRAVVPFREGENGRPISRTEDGILILLERNCSPVYPGEVWRGILRAHPRGFYVFSPEELLKTNPSLRDIPPFVVVKDLATPILLLVRLKFSDGLEKVIAVKPAKNQQVLQVESLQKVARRFQLSQRTLTYSDAQNRIKNLKRLYRLRFNEEALENLFKGLPEPTSPIVPPTAHSHKAGSRWMLSTIFKEMSGKLIISTQCRFCGKYILREFHKFSAMDRRLGLCLLKLKIPERGKGKGRITLKRKKSKYSQNMSNRGHNNSSVIHKSKNKNKKWTSLPKLSKSDLQAYLDSGKEGKS